MEKVVIFSTTVRAMKPIKGALWNEHGHSSYLH